VIPVNNRYDEVSAKAQVPLLDEQQLDATTDSFEAALHPNNGSSGVHARRFSLFTSVVDLALVLKRKYFT